MGLEDIQILMISSALILLPCLSLGINCFYKKKQLHINLINSLIVLWFLNSCIPILFNLVQTTAQFGIVQCALWVFSFTLIANSDHVENNWVLFKKLILTLGCLFALYAIMQHYLFDYMATGPFNTRTSNGAFLMVAALLLAAKLLYEQEESNNRIIIKAFFFLLFFTLNLGILLSFSRGVYLSYTLSLLFLIIFNAKCFRNTATIGLIILLSLLFLQLSAPQAIQHRLDMLAIEQSRILIWKGAWHLWQHTPWYGIGIENYKYFYPAFSLPGDGSSLEYAHNDYLQLLIETGILGISLLLSLILAFVYYCIRYFKARITSSSQVMLVTQMAVLLSLLLHSCVDFLFYIVPFNILLGILFGFLYRNLKTLDLIPSINLSPTPVKNKILGLIGGGTVAFLGTILFHLFFYNYHMNQARYYINLKKLPAAINSYQQAKQHFKSPYTYNNLTSLYMERLKETEDKSIKHRLITLAERIIGETIQLHPYNAEPYFQQGIIQSLYLNNNKKAQAAFEQFVKLKPHANFERLTYCFFLLKQEQFFAAQELLEKGLRYPIYPYYAPKYLDLLAQLRLDHGDKLGAIQVNEALTHIDTLKFDFSSLAIA